jgi:hypothetical protein
LPSTLAFFVSFKQYGHLSLTHPYCSTVFAPRR